jgi:hypothetical protein
VKTKKVTLQNPRTREIWICEDFTNRRTVDEETYVEVHQPHTTRAVWMSLHALVKIDNTHAVGG